MIAQVSDSMVKIVCGFLLWQQRFYLFEDAVQFLLRLCPQHGYPGVAEIGNPFEERACCQVAAHVQYAPCSSSRLTLSSTSWRSTFSRHSELGEGVLARLQICFTS